MKLFTIASERIHAPPYRSGDYESR